MADEITDRERDVLLDYLDAHDPCDLCMPEQDVMVKVAGGSYATLYGLRVCTTIGCPCPCHPNRRNTDEMVWKTFGLHEYMERHGYEAGDVDADDG